MNDAKLIERLIVSAYNTGYYRAKGEDDLLHHLEAIEERGRLRDVALQRLGDLRAALNELLAAREMRSRVGLWPVKFPHIGRSAKEPKSASRNRFEVWYTRATCRVIKAEEQACACAVLEAKDA